MHFNSVNNNIIYIYIYITTSFIYIYTPVWITISSWIVVILVRIPLDSQTHEYIPFLGTRTSPRSNRSSHNSPAKWENPIIETWSLHFLSNIFLEKKMGLHLLRTYIYADMLYIRIYICWYAIYCIYISYVPYLLWCIMSIYGFLWCAMMWARMGSVEVSAWHNGIGDLSLSWLRNSWWYCHTSIWSPFIHVSGLIR